MYLVDTDVLINLSRGKLPKDLLKWDRSESVSDVSYMEFAQGCRNRRELDLWIKVSRRFQMIPITESVSLRAKILMEQFALSHGLAMGDALIAATALSEGVPLLTGNKKHFHFVPGLKARFV